MPLLVPAITLLPVMLSVVPVALPELLIPWKIEAPEPKAESFWTVLFVIEIVPVAAFKMPTKVVTAVVVGLIPTWIEFAAVVLPTVLPLSVTLAPAPLVSMPRTTKPIVAVALLAVMPPTLLFWTLTVAPGAAT